MKTHKTCKKCTTTLPRSSFQEHIRKDNGKRQLHHICKRCESIRVRMRKYKLTYNEVDRLLNINNCEICDTSLTDQKKCIDHCHETGVVRGVLCRNCNLAIGLLNDNADTMISAINYLNKTIC